MVEVKNEIPPSITGGTRKQALQHLLGSLKILTTFLEGGLEIHFKSFIRVESRSA